MPDPGAIGTLIIGLESIRQDELYDERRRHRVAARARTRDGRSVRLAAAAALRSIADRLDRPLASGATG